MLTDDTLSRFGRLASKELKETLRDRRTLVTLFLMPLILYPVLSLVMSRLLLSNVKTNGATVYRIGVATQTERNLLERAIATAHAASQIKNLEPLKIHWTQRQNSPLVIPSNASEQPDQPAEQPENLKTSETMFDVVDYPNGDLNAELMRGEIDAVVNVQRLQEVSKVDFVPLSMDVQFRENDSPSESAVIELRKLFASLNEMADARNRMVLRIPNAIPIRMDAKPTPDAKSDRLGLAGIVPLIIILMTITGGVYPAIDLTAGERERGTLEALIASPISRFQLVATKYVAVLTVSILTAVINLLAMTITLKATGVGDILMGSASNQILLMLRALPLVMLFAAFFSGVLIGLCSFARSFKEAQAYLIPVVLLSLGPGVLSMMPSVKLTTTVAAAPQINLILLARDVIHQSDVSLMVILIVVLTTVFYTVAALLLAAKGFGDQVAAAGDDFRWGDLLQRPQSAEDRPTVAQLLGYLSLFFPFYFFITGWLYSFDLELSTRAIVGAVAVVLLFLILPWAYSNWLRLNDSETFRIKIGPMPVTAMFVAVLLIPVLWIFAFEILNLTELIGIKSLDLDQLKGVKEAREKFLEVPFWLIVLTMAIVPAIAEEFFFRGFALSALSNRQSTMQAIIWSSVLFGLFHMFSGSLLTLERFLPTAMLGLFLGILATYSKSLFPGMVLHAGHNALLFSFPYLDNFFARLGFDRQSNHLPWQWIAGGSLAIVIAMALLFWRAEMLKPKKEPVTIQN